MTKAEERKFRKMEIRVAELEKQFSTANLARFDQFSELFEVKCALKQAFAAIEEAAVILHECIKNDADFVEEKRQLEVIGDF